MFLNFDYYVYIYIYPLGNSLASIAVRLFAVRNCAKTSQGHTEGSENYWKIFTYFQILYTFNTFASNYKYAEKWNFRKRYERTQFSSKFSVIKKKQIENCFNECRSTAYKSTAKCSVASSLINVRTACCAVMWKKRAWEYINIVNAIAHLIRIDYLEHKCYAM